MLKQIQIHTAKQVLEIPLNEICRNPHQPRQQFDEHGIAQLSKSIAMNGLLQPIAVRRVGRGYELIAGERRMMACQRLGLDTIPAMVVNATDTQSAIFALIENIQRSELHYFEEADAIKSLLQNTGIRQEVLAEQLGKAPSTIANKIRLCAIPQKLRQQLMEHHMSERHARALLKVIDYPGLLETAVNHICKYGYTVAQTEKYLVEMGGEKKFVEKIKPTHKLCFRDTRLFMNTIRKAVSTMKLAGFDISTNTEENDEYVFLTMRIPKQVRKKTFHKI